MKAAKFVRHDRQKNIPISLYLFFLAIICVMVLSGSFAQAATADLAITSAPPPAATVGTAYSFTFTASGGTPPYTWDASLVSPDITQTTWWFSYWDGPINGMTFDATSGTLFGAPVFTGALPLRVKVTDADNRHLTLVYDFMVNGSGSPRLITNAPPAGTEGSAYSFRFTTSWTSILGCDPGIFFIDGSLPPGLSLNLISGDIGQPPNAYGTPIAAGVYTFTVSAASNIYCISEPTETNAYTFTISISPASSSSSPDGAANWSRNAGNPVLRVATSGWDNGQIASPSVFKVGSNYRMYYEGQDTTTHTWQIGLATSSDGVTWSRSASNPVLPKGSSGAWDEFEVRYPSVHYDGATYRMWYWGRGSIDDIAKIGFATSSDGVNWTKYPTPVLGTDFGGSGFIPGSVIKSGNSFIMWYATQYGDIQRTTSNDGIIWDTPQTVISDFNLKRPVVILDNGVYRAWFGKWDTGDNGGFAGTISGETRINIGYASSPDGITWTLYQQSTSLCTFCITTDSIVASLPEGALGAWDRPGVGQPWVIKDGGQYKMWYTGGRIHRPYLSSLNNVSYVEGAIGYATSGGSRVNVFSDVPLGYWAEDYINAIYNAGITTGCAQDDPGTPENERQYCPEDNVSREQMAAFIVRAVEGEPASNYCDSGSLFPDVTPDMWSCKYIKRLKELGITTGYGDGTYGPYDLVPREQMAAFIVRAVEGEPAADYCDSGSLFPDVTPDMWSCKYIKRLKELNITTGYQDGTYGPDDYVTRAQMAAFLARAFLGMP